MCDKSSATSKCSTPHPPSPTPHPTSSALVGRGYAVNWLEDRTASCLVPSCRLALVLITLQKNILKQMAPFFSFSPFYIYRFSGVVKNSRKRTSVPQCGKFLYKILYEKIKVLILLSWWDGPGKIKSSLRALNLINKRT